jgi:tRNA(fMet)-specific endonuclease VapC
LVPFSPEEVAVSVVTVEEMLRGRLAILARRSDGEARVHAYTKLLETVRFFSTIPVISFDMACEQQFQALRAMRLRMGSRDLRIAATALVHSVVLISRNRRHFEQVPGLRLDDWSL